jgi:branched-chain amino acid transport system ATP-binding protein
VTDLAVNGIALTQRFGEFQALRSVDIRVRPGERRALIGPNGAGKSTLFNLLAGQLRPTSGRVELHGKDVTRLGPAARARFGVGRTFQMTRLFGGLTVADNVELTLACNTRAASVFWKQMGKTAALRDRAMAELASWNMQDVAGEIVDSLSYGQQRILEIILATCRKPSILLLDEPTAGLPPADAAKLTALVGNLARSTTIVMIEHDMDVAFSLADSVTVLCNGAILSEGDPDAVAADEAVLEAYLGVQTDA